MEKFENPSLHFLFEETKENVKFSEMRQDNPDCTDWGGSCCYSGRTHVQKPIYLMFLNYYTILLKIIGFEISIFIQILNSIYLNQIIQKDSIIYL